MSTLQPELYWLTLTVISTAVMWAPYIVALIGDHGIANAFLDGDGVLEPKTKWALRAKQAHYNSVENLVVLAPLVLVVVYLGKSDTLTTHTIMLYFFVRIAHFFTYLAGIPVVRTLIFLVGFACQLLLGLRILSLI